MAKTRAAVTRCSSARPDEQGRPNRRTLLLRNGVVVASSPHVMPRKTYGHHTWFDMRCSKHGDTIAFQVKYVSKNMWIPWDPGTADHGEAVLYRSGAAAGRHSGDLGAGQRHHRRAGTPFFQHAAAAAQRRRWWRIADPAYPEWANIGQPLTLDYPAALVHRRQRSAFARGGRAVPKGEEASAVVQGVASRRSRRGKTAEYWYRHLCRA